ncbi:Glucose / Sorbosone dehydrogenase [Methylobacterium sp. UNCCL125]|nr:Glucose / Sorbosone dehydrogenase [Methylobacterium sp. UNCCL125]
MTPIRQPILIRSLTAALAGLSFGLMDHGRAAAQETAATAAPPPSVQVDRGSALYGRPEGGAAAKLAPVAGPPLAVAAAKLPLDKLKVPEGFKIEVYASGLANAREMTQAPDGTLYVGTRTVGKVYAVLPKADGDGKREVKTIASGLHRPNGVAYHDGALYVAELSKIWRYDDIANHLDGAAKPTLVYDDLPKDEAHGWKFIAIGPDNKLYVPVGAPGNIVMPPDTHAQIRRMDLDGKNAEVIARGVRNTVGFDWNPKTKQLWFTDNGRDWVSEDIPNDELNVLTEPGKQHSAIRTATRAPSRIRNTAGVIPARNSPRRRRSSARTRLPSACGSTPARSSRRPTGTRCSSPGTARGTAPPSSVATWSWPSPDRTARPQQRSRS